VYTGADPVPGAGEPLGVARGVGVDEEARLLAAVAEGAEGVVAVAAAAAVPVALPTAAAPAPAATGPRPARRRARACAAASGHRR
jgi:nucleoid-associated protein YgaU